MVLINKSEYLSLKYSSIYRALLLFLLNKFKFFSKLLFLFLVFKYLYQYLIFKFKKFVLILIKYCLIIAIFNEYIVFFMD